MNVFKLKIATPDGEIFDGDAVKLDVRGTLGDLAVMSGHAPFVTAVVPCECRILLPDGEERSGNVQSGILSVTKDETVLLTSNYKQI